MADTIPLHLRPSDESAHRFAGSIRTGEDELRVTISLVDNTVILTSNTEDLGMWPKSDVEIAETADAAFEFVAEGDRLEFVPDEPDELRTLDVVSPYVPDRTIRRRRRERRPKAERRRREPKQRATQAPRTPRRERAEPWQERRPAVPEPVKSASKTGARTVGKGTHRVWMWSLKKARKYDVLGLDRVPVTKDMRRAEHHEHTWDHKLAEGVGRHICTVCGKVRLRRR